MKNYVYIAVAAVFGLAIAFVFVKSGDARSLNVNDIGSDPAAFTGKISVVGVTAGVSQADPTIFGIYDKKELQCKSPNCNKIIIPVKYSGAMPKAGDEVVVSGSFVNMGGGYLFSGETVKVVRNHQVGG